MHHSRHYRIALCATTALAIVVLCAWPALAQRGGGGRGGGGGARGGGGAKSSMARAGGGGARPSMSRPSGGGARPSMSRPSPSRPSMGNAGGRPSMPRPSGGGNRPSMGGARPSLGGAGGRPNMSRPANPVAGNRPSLPNAQNRPSVRPPSSLPSFNRPSTRPSLPNNGNRPSFGNNRPGGGDRPTFGDLNRPTTLPGNSNRPGAGGGGIQRPGIDGNRPGAGGGGIQRPGIDGNRPGGNFNRPANRPVIGGNHPNFGNDTNINIGNKVSIGNQVGDRFTNRPNWDAGSAFSRPDWGLNGHDWHGQWHDHCIHDHHYWYNGCWHGYWGSSWYAPIAWGAVGWGLGYGSSYYNPYYAEPVVAQAMPYDYSQPVVVNNYASSDAQGGEANVPQTTPEQQKALALFDDGLAHFKGGDYDKALTAFNAVLKQLPNDAVAHEVRCLALFAIGDYKAAAAGLNSLLSAAPGMDWTTMSGLYGKPDDYTAQLRELEQFCQSHLDDASAHFVLAYHYMVTGSKEDAIDALRVVVKNQPKDVTAKRMLDAMVPPADSTAAAPTRPAPEKAAPAETDLVGSWAAQAGDTKIELAISEDSKFTWKASPKGLAPVELNGQLVAAAEGIELETAEQGSIAGMVESKGVDAWRFAINGAPASDPGLSFARVK